MGQRRKIISKTEAATTNQPGSAELDLQPEDKSLPSHGTEMQPEQTRANAATQEKSRKLKPNATPRRSMRRKNVALPLEDEIERVIEEVTLTDSEKEEDDDQLPVNVDVEVKLPESTLENLKEKIDHLISLVEDHRQEQMKASTSLRNVRNESSGGAEISYKNLYFDSQKKIGILTDENYQLTLKLERALGKLEAYETTHPLSTGLEKLGELMVATNIVKATETVQHVTSQAIRDALGKKKKPSTRS